jgi:hypothetical protein
LGQYAEYIDLQCTSLVNVPFAKLGPLMPFAMHVWPLLVGRSLGANNAPLNQRSQFALLAFKIHPCSMRVGQPRLTPGLGCRSLRSSSFKASLAGQGILPY